MSNSANSSKDTNPQTTTSDSEDVVSQLRQTINDTDCLLNDIAAKWGRMNPELAKQLQEILKDNQTNDNTPGGN